MRDVQVNRIAGLASGIAADRFLDWSPPRTDIPELNLARQALDGQRLAEAERYLRRALDAAPNCAAVRTLMGLLHERLGEHHAAYRCYQLALTLDRDDTVAGDGILRYCRRFGYDPGSKAINPRAERPA
jgi:tetratricopeptide (TPR) repeat protein